MSLERARNILIVTNVVLVVALIWAWNRETLNVEVLRVNTLSDVPVWGVYLDNKPNPVGTYDRRHDVIDWREPMDKSMKRRVLAIVRRRVHEGFYD